MLHIVDTIQAFITRGLVILILTLSVLSLPSVISSEESAEDHTRTTTTISPDEFVQTSGKHLVYKGQNIVLQGTNFDNTHANYHLQVHGDARDTYYYEADYQKLKELGGNHVRFGLSYDWYANDPENIFYEVLDEQISFAKKHNIWISFNMFTVPISANTDCYEGYSNQCTDFWNSTENQNHLRDFWVEMAERYKNEPAVIGYGLINEPVPPNCNDWFSLASDYHNTIQAVSPNQLSFVPTCIDGLANLQYGSPPQGDNIVYELHDYTPGKMSHDHGNDATSYTYPGPADEWFGTCYYSKEAFRGEAAPQTSCAECDADCDTQPYLDMVNIRERGALNWGDTENVPIYFGEWGAVSTLNGYVQYHQDKGELYNEWDVHHAQYTWKHHTALSGRDYQVWGIFSSQQPQDLTHETDTAKRDAVTASWEGAIHPEFPQETTPTPTSTSTPTPVPTDQPAPTISSPEPSSCDLQFPDVVQGYVFYTPIMNLACDQIVSGFEDGTFQPENTVTRAQMAKFIRRAFSIPEDTSCENFPDVDPDHVFYTEITSLKCSGVISGFEDGSFKPDDQVTRGQAMKFVMNGLRTSKNDSSYLSYRNSDQQFSDLEPGSTFYEVIMAAYTSNIVSGFEDGSFQPAAYTSRGAMAKMVDFAREK